MNRYDPLTPAERSERMSRIGSSDTKPELVVRRLIHAMGYRYRLHARDLPGRPDIVFRSRRKVIFVHGCFWHQHGCNHYRQPRTRESFWGPKLSQNKERDIRIMGEFEKLGWSVMVIWECQIKDTAGLRNLIQHFLEN